MAEHKMVIVDGVRYRSEDAPRHRKPVAEHQSVEAPERPKRARARKAEGDQSDD